MPPEDQSTDEAKSKAELRARIAASAGVNTKTIERNAAKLFVTLFGISENDLEDPEWGPYLKAYLRYLLFGEKSPLIILEDEGKAS